MNRRRLLAFAVGALLFFGAMHWPVQRADISPIYQKWDRPERPPHPIEIYRPPGRK